MRTGRLNRKVSRGCELEFTERSEEPVFMLTAMPSKGPLQSVQAGLWLKKESHSSGACQGKQLIKVTDICPLEMMEPGTLQYKLPDPVLLLGKGQFAGVDIHVRVKGDGYVARIYATRQSVPGGLLLKFCG